MDPLQVVQETIDICLQQGTPTAQSVELVDRTVFLLQISRSLMENFISSSTTSLVLTREVQEVLFQLLVQ